MSVKIAAIAASGFSKWSLAIVSGVLTASIAAAGYATTAEGTTWDSPLLVAAGTTWDSAAVTTGTTWDSAAVTTGTTWD